MISSVCCVFAVSLLVVLSWCVERWQTHRRDFLTGLLTPRALDGFVRSRRGGRFGTLAYLDLNMFREVNRERGHEFGDRLMAALGERFRRELTRAEVGARPGGDEILIFSRRSEDALRAAIDAALGPVVVRTGGRAWLCTVTAVSVVSSRGGREGMGDAVARVGAEARRLKKMSPHRRAPNILPLGGDHVPLARQG